MTDYVFTPDGACPLCGTPWQDADRNSSCDHEAGWYRQWLDEATELIAELITNLRQST